MKFSKFNFLSLEISKTDPAVFTSAAHELYQDDIINLETTGVLYTGLLENTDYFVILNGITADTFQLSTERRGTPIETTGSQSGNHTWIKINRAALTPLVENNR